MQSLTLAQAKSELARVPSEDLPPPSAPTSGDGRRAKILAASMYREMRNEGIGEQEIVAIASQLLGLAAEDLRASRLADAAE